MTSFVKLKEGEGSF